MKSIKKTLIIILLMAVSVPGFSWGLIGHRIVAKIAENHLNDRAKQELSLIFGNEKLENWANWPDFIKSDTSGYWRPASAWHYVNMDSGMDYGTFYQNLLKQTGPNIYTQIKALSEQVKDENTSLEQKKIALIFLIHLVGDLHQPMHVGRYQDLGGNRINVKFFDKDVNLHSLWDDHLVNFQQYSYSEYAYVLDIKSKAEVTEIQSGTLEDWLYDSYQVATYIYDQTPANSVLSYRYNYDFKDIMERQLLYGGLRLAKVMNDIFS